MEEEVNYYVNPIANPLSGDGLRTKILKLARGLNKEKLLKRGVKDVVKSIKKGQKGIVIFAADVSPIDVYSHIPLLCQENGIPYIYVRSRMELGVAAETKKPTSVILMQKPKNENLLEKYEKLFTKLESTHPFM